MANKIWRTLVRTAAAACFVMGSSAQAGGVFYQSDFDPLSFIVKVIYRVDDSCLAQSQSGLVLANSGGPCTVQFWSVVATLTDDSTDPDTTGYIDFVRVEDQGGLYQSIIKAIYVDVGDPLDPNDNQLGGVAMLPTLMGSATTRDGYDSAQEFGSQEDVNGTFWLRFLTLDFGVQIFADVLADVFHRDFQYAPPFDASALLYQRVCERSVSDCRQQVPGDGGVAQLLIPNENDPTSGYVPIVGNFRVGEDGSAIPIPEPGSLALLGGALLAGWLTRRRKAAA